ncbi:helix-turn-helix domain-containing protein [Ruminococcaceae bacterium OttesenSCG-928-L11]|nr:helix-turn-helix domain-containing protein [Ruminococcaceae bacterium OttesenSCG-928-L11]
MTDLNEICEALDCTPVDIIHWPRRGNR